jgi:hypothetical protein
MNLGSIPRKAAKFLHSVVSDLWPTQYCIQLYRRLFVRG